MAVIPALLDIWDMGTDRLTGGWLLDRGIDPVLLMDLGFLVPSGWEGDDLIDDEDEVGQVAAEVLVRNDRTDLTASDGQVASGGGTERYRTYRVRGGWVAEHMRLRMEDLLDTAAVEEVTSSLLYLGTLDVDDRSVPVWLARSLDQEKVRSSVDTELRARNNLGIGLVLHAGRDLGLCLAANVLTPLADHIDKDRPEIVLIQDSLRSVFRRHRILARGGEVVSLMRSGDNMATLHVPGKGSIDILGEHRIDVIQRLVDAHNAGPMPMKTEDLVRGIAEDQSLANIFKQALWDKLKSGFLRSPKKGQWEIAA